MSLEVFGTVDHGGSYAFYEKYMALEENDIEIQPVIIDSRSAWKSLVNERTVLVGSCRNMRLADRA